MTDCSPPDTYNQRWTPSSIMARQQYSAAFFPQEVTLSTGFVTVLRWEAMGRSDLPAQGRTGVRGGGRTPDERTGTKSSLRAAAVAQESRLYRSCCVDSRARHRSQHSDIYAPPRVSVEPPAG